jgi:hypothetical protein
MPSGSYIARILGRKDGGEITIDEVREILGHYPYFSPGQVILAVMLQQSGDQAAARKQLGKAAVYLPDPFLLDHVISLLVSRNDPFIRDANLQSAEVLSPAPAPAQQISPSGPEISTDGEYTPEKRSGAPEGVMEDTLVESSLKDAEKEEPSIHPDTAGATSSMDEPAGGGDSFVQGTGEDGGKEAHPGPGIPAEVRDHSGENGLPATGDPASNFLPTPDAVHEHRKQPSREGTTAAGPDIEDELKNLIRPLYTEDYFAFQGIRLPEKVDDTKKPTSAQVRSFTDWLRAMKRPGGAVGAEAVHVQDKNRISSIYTVDEQAGISSMVEKMALESIQSGEEVITEAMAEIRARQGQRDKAIAIYEKLSLLNPEKSGYFAGKISEIQQPQ